MTVHYEWLTRAEKRSYRKLIAKKAFVHTFHFFNGTGEELYDYYLEQYRKAHEEFPNLFKNSLIKIAWYDFKFKNRDAFETIGAHRIKDELKHERFYYWYNAHNQEKFLNGLMRIGI